MLPAPKDQMEFATLMVAPVVENVTAAEPAAAVGPEIVLGSMVIRLELGASASRIASVARAPMAAS